jgi:hypothetical protein
LTIKAALKNADHAKEQVGIFLREAPSPWAINARCPF